MNIAVPKMLKLERVPADKTNQRHGVGNRESLMKLSQKIPATIEFIGKPAFVESPAETILP